MSEGSKNAEFYRDCADRIDALFTQAVVNVGVPVVLSSDDTLALSAAMHALRSEAKAWDRLADAVKIFGTSDEEQGS